MNSEKIANISEKIIEKFAATGSMRQAYDSVFGDGAYDNLAGEIYEQLKNK